MTSLTQQHSAGQPALALLSSCALTDFTDLPRVGFRGAGSAHYLQSRDFVLPAPRKPTRGRSVRSVSAQLDRRARAG